MFSSPLLTWSDRRSRSGAAASSPLLAGLNRDAANSDGAVGEGGARGTRKEGSSSMANGTDRLGIRVRTCEHRGVAASHSGSSPSEAGSQALPARYEPPLLRVRDWWCAAF